jgi:L-2-hydroxyglutarate oxidase LhgO
MSTGQSNIDTDCVVVGAGVVGVDDLQWLDAAQARAFEPALSR